MARETTLAIVRHDVPQARTFVAYPLIREKAVVTQDRGYIIWDRPSSPPGLYLDGSKPVGQPSLAPHNTAARLQH